MVGEAGGLRGRWAEMLVGYGAASCGAVGRPRGWGRGRCTLVEAGVWLSGWCSWWLAAPQRVMRVMGSQSVWALAAPAVLAICLVRAAHGGAVGVGSVASVAVAGGHSAGGPFRWRGAGCSGPIGGVAG